MIGWIVSCAASIVVASTCVNCLKWFYEEKGSSALVWLGLAMTSALLSSAIFYQLAHGAFQ